MAKLDKQGLNTFIRELDKHINTKINRLDISPKAEKVLMADGTSVEETVSANKTSIQLAIEKSEQAFQRGDEVKTQLVDKLISEGLEVSTDNTFEELIGGIALGKKFATGKSATSGNKLFTYYNTSSGGINMNYITINNLDFIPRIIILESYKNSYYYSSIFINDANLISHKGFVKIAKFNITRYTGDTWQYSVDGKVIDGNSYHIPFYGENDPNTVWIAIE